MDTMQNNMMSHPSRDSKKMVFMLVAVGSVVVGVLWWWMNRTQDRTGSQATPAPVVQDADITSDLNAVNVGDLNADFNAIDKDINSL